MSTHCKHNVCSRRHKEPLYYKGSEPARQSHHGYYDYSGISTIFEKHHENPKENYKGSKPAKQSHHGYYDYSGISAIFEKHHENPKENYKGSKPAKQSHHGYYDYSGISEIFEKHHENPKDKRKHKSKSWRTIKSDFNYENEYDYDSRNEENDYDNYSQTKYKKDPKRSNYSNDRGLHQRKPSYVRRYQPSETGTVIGDDSDSGYSQWDTPRRRMESYYSYQEQYSKGDNFYIDYRRQIPETTDTERSQYRRDLDVYAAHLPRGQNPYMYRREESKLSYDTDDESLSETESQRTYGYSETSALRSEPQVYTPRKMSNNTALSSERLISVVDYSADSSSKNQKNKNSGEIDLKSSEFVYVPVILQEQNPKYEITSSKLRLEKTEVEEQLNNDVQVFAAGNLEQQNIFEKSENVKQKEQSPSDKKKSKIVTSIKRLKSKKSKLNTNENDYPVKKSYINVVSNNHKSQLKSKPIETKDSKCSISKSKGKNQSKGNEVKKDNKRFVVQKYSHSDTSLNKDKNKDDSTVIQHGPSHFDDKSLPKVSSYTDQNYNKDIQKKSGTKGNKKTHTGTLDQKSEVKENFKTAPATLRESPKSHLKHQQTSSIVKQSSKGKEEVPNNQKSHNADIHQTPSVTGERKSAVRTEPGKSSDAKSVTNQRNSRIIKNDSTDKEKHQRVPVGEDSSTVLEAKPSKRTLKGCLDQTSSATLEGKSSTSLATKRDGNPEHSELPKSNKSITKKRKDKRSKHSGFAQSTDSVTMDKSEPEQRGDPIKLWGYDVTPLIYVFQSAQFFLGVTIHDKVMEIANQYHST